MITTYLTIFSLKLELKNMVMCVRVSCEYCDIVSRLINDPKLNFPPRRSNGEVLSLSHLPKFRETAKFAQSREQRRRERTSLAKFKAKLKMTSECATPTQSKINATNGPRGRQPIRIQELSTAPPDEASENPFVGGLAKRRSNFEFRANRTKCRKAE